MEQSTIALVENPGVPVGVLVYIVSIWKARYPVYILDDILSVVIPEGVEKAVHLFPVT